MAMNSENTLLVAESVLQNLCAQVFEKVGVPAEHARLAAVNLIEADLRGVSSHGVVRLPIYVKRLLDGGTNPNAKVSILRQTRTTAVVDGDNGLGHYVGIKAMEIAIDKARDGDCAFVAVKYSNHFGAASHYAEMAARHNMIGLSFTVGAIIPVTPGLFSTTTCVSHRAASFGANSRANTSLPPPGAKPTIRRIGRLGICANA